MPNIYWTRNATAAIGPSGQTDFDDARESAESTSSTTQSTSTNAQVSGYIKSSARGGATFGFKRSYWGFDFTGYTAGDITNLKFNFKPTTSSTGTLGQRFVQFEGFGAEVGSNYSDDEWWDGIESLTTYSDGFNSPDSSTVQAITLNSTAIADAGNDGFLKVALMNITDYNGVAGALDVSNTTNWNIGSNTTGNVYLSFDYSAGFGKNVNNVTAANIVKINNVATANITNLNGVSA